MTVWRDHYDQSGRRLKHTEQSAIHTFHPMTIMMQGSAAADEPIDPPSSSKREIYDNLLQQATSLFEGQQNWVPSYPFPQATLSPIADPHRSFLGLVGSSPSPFPRIPPSKNPTPLTPATRSNLSNTSSLLYHAYTSLPRSSPSHHVNWAGFYTLDPTSPPTSPSLVLGPFQGRVACQTIAFNKGVCGTAAAEKRTVRVFDVHEFPGHIACDERSRSEIVVPILRNGKVSLTLAGLGKEREVLEWQCADG